MTKLNRKQGNRFAVEEKKATISFCFSKLDKNQGQSIEEWQQKGHLSVFITRTQQIGNHLYKEALANKLIKQYTKVGFPPDSEFKPPNHVNPQYWAVIHLTPNSKEVVAGYIEDNVFYVVFLDEDHKFWPTDIQNRGKNRR